MTHDDLAPAWRIISFGPDLSHLLPEGAHVEAWDNIPAMADSLPAAQAAVAARLPELVQGQPE